ncbi:TrlF family AAA-like ATPase [Sporomusa malonica]|uniref:PHP domain-containing protein n=1 Tax=Sporomusa malonica TaxID=112901 RepID=A0A1W1YZ58_9FIRM|nr:PHP domain-containing protein [Sporomusa malonica]SMC41495.1 PHP domain-containing protein [Sporomusa malonica]
MAITFEDLIRVDNGARFFTADLHIHSYGASECVGDVGMTVETIIEQALTHNISIIAITDHNTDKNLEAAMKCAQHYLGRILVIPGVEVSTAHGHLLVYFSPENWENVRTFLARIEIVGKLGSRDSHTTKSMTDVIRQAEMMDGVCIAAHIDRVKTGFEILDSGYPSWKKDIIMSPGLYGLEVDNSENLGWYSPEDEKSANGAERRKLADNRASVLTGRPLLAHVQGSDAHSIKQFSENCAKRNLTRIKMNELDFNAFRTSLVDAEARIRATASLPIAVPRVRGIYINGGFLDQENYHFSDNLNCFIGGRGAGKSTAIRSLVYGLGMKGEFAECDNCPDEIVVYCEDANGIIYRYERIRGSVPNVRAREDGQIQNVPVDVFPVEYYGQGDLAEVAKDPLANPILLQQFLDQHLHIKDLLERQKEILRLLRQNSAQLIPIENLFFQIPGKAQIIAEIDKKLQIAETGKLREIAAQQIELGAEKGLRNELMAIAEFYDRGMSVTNFLRNYHDIANGLKANYQGESTEPYFKDVEKSIDETNQYLNHKQSEINSYFKTVSMKISESLKKVDEVIVNRQQIINGQMAPLKEQGLSGSIQELQQLITRKNIVMTEIGKINGQKSTLETLHIQRTELHSELKQIRNEIIKKRKSQLKVINKGLGRTITDYTVFLCYEDSGIIDEFKEFFLKAMKGSYFQEEVAIKVCQKLLPEELAVFIKQKNARQIAELADISEQWATEICNRMCSLTDLFELELIWKPSCPIINLKTKGAIPKEIHVNQLSDGQKHTILLTIAMLADSKLPLIIDQPEDDLDNAFISASVVTTLRAIKERRQVIVVTHNANIAVLGDAELILPMNRMNDKGIVTDRGSIDRSETRNEVMRILEGGDIAFKRRKEIYGH